VTEAEWDLCTNPEAMLEFLHTTGRLSERKGRLFSVACCRRVWHHLEEPSRRAVSVIERFVEGRASEPERAAAEAEASVVSARLASASFGAADTPIPPESCAAAAVLCLTASAEEEATWLIFNQFVAGLVAMHVLLAEWQALGEAEMERVCLGGEDRPRCGLSYILRDIIGNPFRPMTFDKSWLAPEVVSLAQDIYDEQVFGRMGVLADTLEMTGCTNADILGHCRGPGPHVRGCWLLDLVLGNE
jgi:hypothetical protein